MRPLTATDLAEVWHLLPYTAQALVGCLGAEAAARLLDARPGCELRVPKHADRHPEGIKRWAELEAIIGPDAMRALAQRWGGDVLYLPICDAARRELRDRAIRAEFDRLTITEGYSGKQAIYEIGLKFAPITSRAIELICGKGDAGQSAEQAELF